MQVFFAYGKMIEVGVCPSPRLAVPVFKEFPHATAPAILSFLAPLSVRSRLRLPGEIRQRSWAGKKRAHGDIKKWVTAKGRKLKIEVKFYDDLVLRGVASSEALKMMRLVVDHDLDVGNLGHFVKGKVHGGLKGKKLAALIHKEVKARAEKKKASKAAHGKAKGKLGGNSKGKPKGKAKGKPKGKSGK